MGMFGAGTFKQGGAGRNIAGYLGDALLNLSGGKPVYAPAMQQRANDDRDFQRQMALARYKASQPEPTPMQRNYEYLSKLGKPDLADSYLRAEANPMTLVTDPSSGSVKFAPKGGYPAQAGPPPDAIARLRQNPHETQQFDEIFGAGAASRALGGQ